MALTIGAAALAGGANLLGQGINAFATGKMNRKTRKWNEQMYQRQYDDNLRLWHMQNAYNSPREQMQRLQEAGLNPNLVYGSGSATEAASAPRGADRPTWSPNAPQVDVPSAIGSYFDVTQRKSQNDILAANARAANAEADIRETDRDFKENTYAERVWGYKIEQTLKDVNLQISGYKKDILRDSWTDSVEVVKKQSQYLSEQISSNQAERKRVISDTLRINLENDLRKLGINPNASRWERIIGRIISSFVPDIAIDNIKNNVESRILRNMKLK